MASEVPRYSTMRHPDDPSPGIALDDLAYEQAHLHH
jgi:hypothetical protein